VAIHKSGNLKIENENGVVQKVIESKFVFSLFTIAISFSITFIQKILL